MNIVLLHGFCEDHNIWNELLKFSKNNASTFCIDLPGFGDNAANFEDGNSIELMADFVHHELERLEITNVILIGHSLGGYVTLAMAEKYPEELAAIGLFHSSAKADTEERKAGRLKTIELVKSKGAEAFHRVLIPALFKANTDPAIIENTIAIAKSAKEDGIIAALNAMRNRPDRTAVLSSFAKPILFIAGESDELIPKSAMLEQAALCKIAKVEVLPQSAHMGQIEEAAKSAEIIDDFAEFVASRN